jgi:hypothetical protein
MTTVDLDNLHWGRYLKPVPFEYASSRGSVTRLKTQNCVSLLSSVYLVHGVVHKNKGKNYFFFVLTKLYSKVNC